MTKFLPRYRKISIVPLGGFLSNLASRQLHEVDGLIRFWARSAQGQRSKVNELGLNMLSHPTSFTAISSNERQGGSPSNLAQGVHLWGVNGLNWAHPPKFKGQRSLNLASTIHSCFGSSTAEVSQEPLVVNFHQTWHRFYTMRTRLNWVDFGRDPPKVNRSKVNELKCLKNIFLSHYFI